LKIERERGREEEGRKEIFIMGVVRDSAWRLIPKRVIEFLFLLKQVV
jgi:hypothetical protein